MTEYDDRIAELNERLVRWSFESSTNPILALQGICSDALALATELAEKLRAAAESWRDIPPHDMVIHCPACGKQHLDIGEFATRVHRKHLCENTTEGPGTGCGNLWVPYPYATRGVEQETKQELSQELARRERVEDFLMRLQSNADIHYVYDELRAWLPEPPPPVEPVATEDATLNQGDEDGPKHRRADNQGRQPGPGEPRHGGPQVSASYHHRRPEEEPKKEPRAISGHHQAGGSQDVGRRGDVRGLAEPVTEEPGAEGRCHRCGGSKYDPEHEGDCGECGGTGRKAKAGDAST